MIGVSSEPKEVDVAPIGVVPCIYHDGTCSIPETTDGRVVVARDGLLRAVSRSGVEELLRQMTDEETSWAEVTVRVAALATMGGDSADDEVDSVVQLVGDSSRTVSGVYVKCQPCGHTLVST